MDGIIVTVICMAYNEKKFIREAMDSFLMQKTSFPFEVVVHDDASTDGTAGIIREYAERYPSIVRPVYQTANQYRKTGRYPVVPAFEAARGLFIADCDGDDYWTDPNKIQKQADFLSGNQEYVMCYHPFVKSQLGMFRLSRKGRDYSQEELIGLPIQGHGIHTSTRMYRNLYSPETKKDFSDFAGDYPLNVLLGTFGKAKFIRDILPSVYRIHAHNSWGGMPRHRQRQEVKNTQKILYELMVKRGNLRNAELRRGLVK